MATATGKGSTNPTAQIKVLEILEEAEVSRYMIDGLFPIQGVHLIGGPSGVGKTRFLLKMIETWQSGESFFGHVCHPTPFVYIAADRGRRDAFATMYQMGMNPKTWPLIAHDDVNHIETAMEIVKRSLTYFPKAKVIFVEGFASLLPGGGDKALSNGAVQKFLKEFMQFNKRKDTTIFGTVHAPKKKKEEGYVLSREKILGASAWGAYSNTIVTMDFVNEEDITTPERTITFMPRNASVEVFNLRFNKTGLLERAPDKADVQKENMKILESFVDGLDNEDTRFTTKDAVEYFANLDPPQKATKAKRVLAQAVENGLITKLSHGNYVKKIKDVLDLR